MSMSVQESASIDDMVKALVTRKSRQFQTAVERWSTLKRSSSRSFDRLNLRNKFEEDRLLRKRRVIRDLSEAELKEVFRVKNEMRVTLIDIAKSKREYNNNESDFENRLRTGRHSPIFKMEYKRLKRKQVELEKLSEQLKGPNSKLLASNLKGELKNVDTKAEKEAARGEGKYKYKGKWLAPLKNKAKASSDPSASGESTDTTQRAKSPGTDFANLVQLVHKQFKNASISEKSNAQTSSDLDEAPQSRQNVKACPTSPVGNRLSYQEEPTQTAAELSHKAVSDSGQYPVSRPPKSLIPIASSYSVSDTAATSSTVDSEVEAKRKKRHRKETKGKFLSTVPEISESPPLNEQAVLKPEVKKSKRHRARAQLMKGVQRSTEVTRTDSARRRDRFVQMRLSNLATKTKEDITNRTSISPSDEALNSIHQAEVVTRLQLSRSKVGITLPEVRRDKKARSDARTPKDQAVSLPPLNVEGRLLRELKEQRRKHKNQSTGLPKLP